MTILYFVIRSSFSFSLESSEPSTNSDYRTSEIYDQVLTESILRGEVSEMLSEPCPEISTMALDAFRGAMAGDSSLSLLR
jgi:hypothetical protein